MDKNWAKEEHTILGKAERKKKQTLINVVDVMQNENVH